MEAAAPSRTALSVALRRAAHQVFDGEPPVFRDPYAVPVLGSHAERLWRTPATTPQNADRRKHSRSLRAFLVARSRFAEDALAAGMESPQPPAQYLLLGAGLDTFPLRNGWPALRVFEVDHPATQAWKADLFRAAGFDLHGRCTPVPVDFESGVSLAEELESAGFSFGAHTAVSWLGVVPYLTHDAMRTTLGTLSRLPAGSTLVLDYGQPRHALPAEEQRQHDSLAARVAGAGEPFLSSFTPAEARDVLRESGFAVVEDIGAEEINARYFEARGDGLKVLGSGRLLRAVRAAHGCAL